MKDFSMFKYFKGEEENPFDSQNQNTQYMFWGYEKHFNDKFEKYDRTDWFDFFSNFGLENHFLEITKNGYGSLYKKTVFDLWLNGYLFVHKLFGEYGTENWYLKAYLNPDI